VARFKAGSFLLALQAGLPIVPLAVIGTRHVMRKGRLRTEPGEVTLLVHDPIYPSAGLTEPTVRDAKLLAGRVREIVAAAVGGRRDPSDAARGTNRTPPHAAPGTV
jgi:1-acyl-sn-glycerol-3-phosphate acyltransferase